VKGLDVIPGLERDLRQSRERTSRLEADNEALQVWVPLFTRLANLLRHQTFASGRRSIQHAWARCRCAACDGLSWQLRSCCLIANRKDNSPDT